MKPKKQNEVARATEEAQETDPPLQPLSVLAESEAKLNAAKAEAAPTETKIHDHSEMIEMASEIPPEYQINSLELDRLRNVIAEETTMCAFSDEQVINLLLSYFNRYLAIERPFRQIIRADWENRMRTVCKIDPENPNFIRVPLRLANLDRENRKMDTRLRRLYRRIQDPNSKTDWGLIRLYQKLYREYCERTQNYDEMQEAKTLRSDRNPDAR
jgi:hypothetical protein